MHYHVYSAPRPVECGVWRSVQCTDSGIEELNVSDCFGFKSSASGRSCVASQHSCLLQMHNVDHSRYHGERFQIRSPAPSRRGAGPVAIYHRLHLSILITARQKYCGSVSNSNHRASLCYIAEDPWCISAFIAITNRLMLLLLQTWRSWLRHCATSRKVAGSIPDVVIGIFHWLNPFGRTMALGSTQPLTELSTKNISWGVKAAGE
jgi:hypothetical protein